MGGKRKVSNDTVGMSKTARASLAKKGKSEGFLASGELDRVYSLGGGEYARILDPRNGKSHHVRVGSAPYDLVVTELLATNHGEKVRTELVKLRFPLPDVEAV